MEEQDNMEIMENMEEQMKIESQVKLEFVKIENLVKHENIKFGQSLSYRMLRVEGEQKCLLDSSTAEVVSSSTTLNADE